MSAVRRNILWNLLGNVLPLLAGLIFFPFIIHAYGLDRFGLLTLAWALVGYFGLFDLGLSRALTQLVSDLMAKKSAALDITSLIETGFILMWALGFIGGALLWFLTPWIVVSALKIDQRLQHETILAFSLLSLAIPLVIHTSAMRGVLEALHLFKSASLIRAVLGVGTFLAPYLASVHSQSLVDAISALIALRLIVWLMHFVAIRRSNVMKASVPTFNLLWMKPLFSFGGWMTVSNIVGPLMTYMDRFVIASVLGAATVAYYVAPYEVLTKMLVVPVAVAGVLFPLFAKEWQLKPAESAHRLNQGILYTLIVLFPVCLLLGYFAREWLSLWIGNQFGEKGLLVVIWLVAGILINSIAQIFFAKVQGAGRSDWTAKLHLVELFPYLGLLWLMLHFWGVAGAAFAWFVRCLVDAIGLVYFAGKINSHNLSATRYSLMMVMLAIVVLLISSLFNTLAVRVGVFAIVLFIYGILAVKQLRRDNVFSWALSYFFRRA